MSGNAPSTDVMMEDLQYVKSILNRRGFNREEFVVALVWAVVNLVGLSLYDFSMFAGGVFWIVALPVFGIGTGVWAGRRQKEAGEINRELGRLHALHWTAIPIFLIACNTLFIGSPMNPQHVGQVVLLVIGLVYYLGGVHFWRGYMYGGLGMLSGMLWLAIIDSYPWTLTGVLTFLGLLIPSIYDWRRHGNQG